MIKDYKNILVPVDGSKNSSNALKEAIKIFKNSYTKVTVIHVRDAEQTTENPYEDELVLEYLNEEELLIKKNIDKQMKNFENFDLVFTIGNPKYEIVKYSKNKKIDFIIMGATGKNSIERILVGSVTSYVLNHTDCNVLIVK